MKKINAFYILLVLLGLQINVQAQQIKKVFDFGQEQHLPEATYVGTALPYNSDMRYGFDFGTAYRVAMQEQGFTAGIPVYFSVDLPEGNYKVTVTLSGKNTEMTVKAESKRLFIPQEQIGTKDEVTQSFTVSVFNPIIETGKKVKLKDRELVKLDWDHKLTLEFLGTSTVQSIIIESVDTRTLFLAGDSTVTDQDLEPWASWGQFITAYLNEEIAVANQASSGASLASFRGSRIDKVLSQLKADDFVIITGGVRSGTFSAVQYDGSTLAPDFEIDGNGSFRDHVAGGLFRSVTYTSTAVSVQNLLASEGDTDGDLDVDTVDLTGMIMNYTGATGSGKTWNTGDTDGDGDVDSGDLTTAIINFTGASNAAAAVPEPSSLLLLVLAVGCLAATRGRSYRS